MKIFSRQDYYFLEYVGDDFLGRLDPKSEGKNPNGTDNDNGILFNAMCFMFFVLQKQDLSKYQKQVEDCINSLRESNGYFKRSPTDDRSEAHDNYIGICFFGVVFNLELALEICEVGEKVGWRLDKNQKDKPRIEFLRQGGDIAFYQLCTLGKRKPLPWDCIWLVIGSLIALFKKYPSSINLAWLRYRTLALANEKVPFDFLSRAIIGMGDFLFSAGVLMLGGMSYSFQRYFKPDHPIHSFNKEHYGD